MLYLYQLGRPVGRLDVLTNVRVFPCTAFLVSPKFVLTNYHCVPGVTELPDAQMIGVKRIEAVQLKLGYTRQGVEEGARSYTVSPVPVEADKGLDYAILEVFGEPAAEFGFTRLAAAKPQEKMPLIIIGHPQGWAQHVSLLRCRSDDPAVSAGQLRHTCDTLPGNSGSPVFDADSRAAIALHHAGSAAQSINYAVPLSDIIAKSKLLQTILREQVAPKAGDVPAGAPPKAAEPKVLPKAGDQVAIVAPPPAVPPVPAPAQARCTGVEVEVVGTGKTCLDPADANKREFSDCSGSGEGRVCGPQMVVVPAGRFTMGSPASEKDRSANEGPQHEVTIAKPFAVGKFEVTLAQYLACVADKACPAPEWQEAGNKYNVKTGSEGHYKKLDAALTGKDNPIVGVSWNDAQAFAKWLSTKTGMSYRLLTEAEWEYAARASMKTRYSWGDEIGNSNANCDGCGSKWDNKQTAPVGSFKANAFGLHDMHGNVWEWVQDCYADSYKDAPTDGSAVPDKPACSRVLRGGSWNYNPRLLRAANRLYNRPVTRFNGSGFRVARSVSR